jgi:5-methylcytosine-specific restriction protein A
MINNNHYVYKKEVDWSVLHQGVSIPVTIQIVFHNAIKKFLPRGQSIDIYLVLEGKTCKARLVNQKFDERKYPSRSDILQIRYNPQSEIAQRLRAIFAASYRYILEQRNNLPESPRKIIRVPENQREFLAIYTTEYPDTYLLECITQEDTKIIRKAMVNEDEQEYEASINYNTIDPTATIATVNQVAKIRKLNRAIGETLKLLYNYRCQICGENISARYGVNIVESHHIDPFVESLNNNAENQIIICPNHHRIIHRARPVFDRRKLIFVYHNGLEERVILNQHL